MFKYLPIRYGEETDFLELKGYGIGLSGLISKYDPRHVQRIKQEIQNVKHEGRSIVKVQTLKLSSILEKYDIVNIDFYL